MEDQQRATQRILGEEVEKCAKADCLQFTKVLYEKLPRELREMVYQYIYVDERPIPIGSYHFTSYDNYPNAGFRTAESDYEDEDGAAHQASLTSILSPNGLRQGSDRDRNDLCIIVPEGATTEDHSTKPPSDVVLPSSHVLDPTYVHMPVLLEASEYYYSNNAFSVCNVESALENFLFRDIIHNFQPQSVPVGLVPNDFVRKLQIRVKCEHYEDKTGNGLLSQAHSVSQFPDEPLGVTPPGPLPIDAQSRPACDAREKNFIRTLYQSVTTPLRHIKLKDQLELEFIIMTKFYMDEIRCQCIWANFLEAVREAVYDIIHSGSTVKVNHYDTCRHFVPIDITKLFQLFAQQWEGEKSARSSDWDILHHYVEPSASAEIVQLALRNRWGLQSAWDRAPMHPIEDRSS